MSASKPCGATEIERSACMIELILADLRANYREVGGGGITRIEAGAGMSYAVSLPQEERTDVLTYEFEFRGGAVVMKRRTESTESY